MTAELSDFDEHAILHELKHYLPAQAPLKDFVHHNTLHAFQQLDFFKATHTASEIFGYRTSLSLKEFRDLYHLGKINNAILERLISEKKLGDEEDWKAKLVNKRYGDLDHPRIGALRASWKKEYKIDISSLVHPTLFRILCSYLDQGIALWNFPAGDQGLLSSIRELEKHSFVSFFKTKRARNLLIKSHSKIFDLLVFIVGDASLFKQYIFDQQFSHQGWSGMVSAIEDNPHTLLDKKNISIKELIILELLLELDALDYQFGENWAPLGSRTAEKPMELFAEVKDNELTEVLSLWQQAFEWTYYDQVLAGIHAEHKTHNAVEDKSFQALFCLDDRECSFRRYLEKFDPLCETFGTPGHFNIEFFFQPEHGKFYTKLCPAPVTPKHLIKEVGVRSRRKKDMLYAKHANSLLSGWLISQTLGFWSAFRLFWNIFKPSASPATSSSFGHMIKLSKLTIENRSLASRENDLQVGFTVDEMADRAEGLLKSIGLVQDFAPIVYIIGHGSSTINNPHYAAYDCGACCGRPGSVNARVMSHILNLQKVREILQLRGLDIPPTTQFVGGLHDTTRDDIMFFDENHLSAKNAVLHKGNEVLCARALNFNAKERARRFESINTKWSPEKIHEAVRIRSVSLFEPRPELNHATNALCVVGRREMTKGLFLDRRSFMNSYDYRVDLQGKYLLAILEAAAPVCGGINLEYFFSRVDNQKLGAGTKLPHNVMGLFGVANGIEGDLRPGLPSQMIEVHDPLRLLMIVEHFPEVVLETIKKSPKTYEWFINQWVNLAVINPQTLQLYVFKDGQFSEYYPLKQGNEVLEDLMPVLETHRENLPVYAIT